MNFIPGRLKKAGETETLIELSDGTCLRAAIDSRAALAGYTVAGYTVTLGTRPEQLRLHYHANNIEALTVQVECLGDHSLIYLDQEAGDQPLVIRCGAEVQLGMGTRLQVGLPPADCHLFDRDGIAFSRTKEHGIRASKGDGRRA